MKWPASTAWRWRALTLRTTFVIAFAVIAVAVTGVVGVLGYSEADRGLRGEVERSLVSAAETLSAGGTVSTVTSTNRVAGAGETNSGIRDDQGIIQAAQTLGADGSITVLVGNAFAADPSSRPLATASAGTQHLETIIIDSRRYRVLTLALGEGRGAIQVTRDLTDTESVLDGLAINTALAALAVIVVAGVIGLLLARYLTRRLTALTLAAEKVASTGHLDVDFGVGGPDEVSRLAVAMQQMLAEIAQSRNDQRSLVQDAGHELRTPLTSLRTNLSVLRRFEELSPTSRARLLDDVDGESRELTDLVNELVELATDRRTTEAWQHVNLIEVVNHVCDLFRRRSDREIHIITQEADPVIMGQAHSLERAVSNLLDNAIKFDPQSTAPIEVSVSAQEISVADRGPGLAVAELDRVFDRFYRSPEARSLPGSGLGLSIVKDVAQAHGGSANAANRAGGGAVISFTFAGEPISTADSGR